MACELFVVKAVISRTGSVLALGTGGVGCLALDVYSVDVVGAGVGRGWPDRGASLSSWSSAGALGDCVGAGMPVGDREVGRRTRKSSRRSAVIA